jgi:antitoxin component of RelBE/YafQ-DinJ toxin-antitoxin module
MCTITLKINESDSKAKEFLLYIEKFAREHNSVDVLHSPNEETLQAFNDIENGNVFKANDVDDLFRQLEEE